MIPVFMNLGMNLCINSSAFDHTTPTVVSSYLYHPYHKCCGCNPTSAILEQCHYRQSFQEHTVLLDRSLNLEETPCRVSCVSTSSWSGPTNVAFYLEWWKYLGLLHSFPSLEVTFSSINLLLEADFTRT